MAYGTYEELKSAVLDELNRANDAGTIAAIPGWIALAEADIRREISTKNVTINESFSIDAASVTLDAEVGEVEALWLNDTAYGPRLDKVTPEHLGELRAQYPGTGTPGWYAVINGELHFAPTPDQTYTGTIIYEPLVTPMTASDDTNWVLTNHPDLYFYGSLLHCIGFLGFNDQDTINFWGSRYQNAIQGLAKEKRRHEYGGPLVAMPRRAIGA